MNQLMFREGNGDPLHCSCLENSMERGARMASVQGVAKSDRTEYGRVHLMVSSITFIVNFLYLNILPV